MGPVLTSATTSAFPINNAARLFADSWDASRLTLQEHQCRVHVAPYIYHGPLNLRIWEEKDPETQQRHRDQELHQHLRADAHDLDGRPSASIAVRAAHLHGFLDRPLGGQQAHRHDHASEAGLAAAQRRSRERSDDDGRALRPARQVPDARRHHFRSGVPGRADGSDHGLSDRHARQRHLALAVRIRRGDHRPAKGEVPHYLPGENPFLSEIPRSHGCACGGRERRTRDDLSRVPGATEERPARAVSTAEAPRVSQAKNPDTGTARGSARAGQRLLARGRRRQRHRAGRAVRRDHGGLEVRAADRQDSR